jgi:hypothetical protein
VSQLGLAPGKLLFIDETWAKTNMTRLRGRAMRGQRLVAKVPHGHWKTTTLIAALGDRGMRCSTTVDGAVNREVFEAFVQQVLVPSLSPGDIVVMDNLSSHKGQRVRALIESPSARRRCTCRRTARISTRSSWRSQSSSNSCDLRHTARWRRYGVTCSGCWT